MKLFCPECSTFVLAEKINFDELVAVCPNCNNLFAFNQSEIGEKTRRKKIIKPWNLHIYENHDSQVINYNWFRWRDVVFLAPVTLIIDAISLTTLSAMPDLNVDNFLGFVLLIIPFSLFLSYQLLALLFNSTYISLSPDQIRVYHRPIPVFGNFSFSCGEIAQLYCEHKPRHAHRRSIPLIPNVNRIYELHVILHDGSNFLFLGTDEEDFAQYIGQRIRRYIGLEGVLPFKDATGKFFS